MLKNDQGRAIETKDTAQPNTDRYESLDVLRGVSLLGILLLNARAVLNPIDAPRGFIDPGTADLDRAAYWLLQVTADAKFYPIFSVLFGAGLALQWERRASLPSGFFRRRLIALFVLGAVHGNFLWWGDILLPYAVVAAIVVVVFLKRPPSVNAVAGALLILGAIYVSALLVADTVSASAAVSLTTGSARHANGLGWEQIARNASDYARALTGWSVIGFQVLGLMLLGVAWVQSSWLRRMMRGSFWSVKVDAALWIVGAVFNALFVLSDAAREESGWLATRVVYTAGFILGGSLLGLAIALTVLRLMASGRAWWFKALAPAGRMSLSNYLLGTLGFVALAHGLGPHGRLGNGAAAGVAVVLFIGQVALAFALARKRRTFPLERVWRALSYGVADGRDVPRGENRRDARDPVVLDGER